MDQKAFSGGVAAFREGLMRTANPFDASTEDWMCWRDGWEQAKAVADHVVDGTADACYGALARRRREAAG